MSMSCNIKDHKFGVDHDIEFACEKCRSIFVEPERVWPLENRFSIPELQKSLKLNFGKYWKFEWIKLVAVRDLVRKIRMAKPTKDSMCLKLDQERIYTLSDFNLPTRTFLRRNEQ